MNATVETIAGTDDLEVYDRMILKDSGGDPGERVVTVCAWCLPGEKLFTLYPHLEGNVKISHGICPRHKREFISALDSF